MKIIAFVTHPPTIRRILAGLGWPTVPPQFDPPQEPWLWDVCQLVPGTEDGFHPIENQLHPDELFPSGTDPPHWEDMCRPDTMHAQEAIHEHAYQEPDPPYWEDMCQLVTGTHDGFPETF